MDLTGAEVEVDVVVRDDARKPLRDPAEFENVLAGHRGDSTVAETGDGPEGPSPSQTRCRRPLSGSSSAA